MVDERLWLTRRRFLKLAAVGLGGLAASAVGLKHVLAQPSGPYEHFNTVADPDNPTELEKQHLINIRLPVIAEDGANVPIIVSLENHPMQADHHIKSIQILNFNDPVVSKGVFRFTPANGLAYISTQIRMDGGDPTIFVVCECSQHGKWVASKQLKVSLGGC
jgi:predicted secreted protein